MGAKGIDALLSPRDQEPDHHFQTDGETRNQNGTVVSRFRQYFRGVPLWGERVVIIRHKGEIKLRGRIVNGLAQAVSDVTPAFTPAEAVQWAKAHERNRRLQAHMPSEGLRYENEQAELVIYADNASQACLAYVVSFFADLPAGGCPTRPFVILDAKTKRLLRWWQGLETALEGIGPGGNAKTGTYYYGTQYGKLDVKVNAGICTMETNDVKTINMNHTTTATAVYTFPYPESNADAYNDAYSPLNDLHYFGCLVFKMYADWYGTSPSASQMTLRAHFNISDYPYSPYFYYNNIVTFTDGNTALYPCVTIDIVAHEMSHAYTDWKSGLIFEGQSGAIADAFASMGGEAAEYFRDGTNDFWLGTDAYKQANMAFAYMDDPPRDGRSIAHLKDYEEGMDVHYSSGIFRKAFYLLATNTAKGWNTRKAFEVFCQANPKWTPKETFVFGAGAVRDTAEECGYPAEDVEAAFQAVGIDLTQPALQITEPAQGDTSTGQYAIKWKDHDYYHSAKIALYYDTDNRGQNGVQMVADIEEDNTVNAYAWDTTAVPTGIYYIYGILHNGVDEDVLSYSPGTVTVLNPDAYEPDNTTTTASTILVNETQAHHSIVPAADMDWIKFSVSEAPFPVQIRTQGYGGNPEMWLYDSQGTGLLAYNDNIAGSMFPAIIYTLGQPGTYYVLVGSANSAAVVMDYSLRVAKFAPTPTTTSTPTPFATPTSTPRPEFPQGGSAAPNPFVPGPGKKVTFNFRLDAGRGYTIRILNLRGALVRTLQDTNAWDGTGQDGQGCEAGVYIYQIESQNQRVSGQMVLIK